jgi:hypothetical protein
VEAEEDDGDAATGRIPTMNRDAEPSSTSDRAVTLARIWAFVKRMATVFGLLSCSWACTRGAPISIDDALPMLWSDDFEGANGPIQAHDSSWAQIFGHLNVDSDFGAVVADVGEEDGDDDYAYRPQLASDLTITADVFWDATDGVGVELICPPGAANESLYELTIYEDRLQLLRYDGGGDPSVYEVVSATRRLRLSSGDYTLVLRARYEGTRWRLLGELRGSSSEGVIASIKERRDATHGPSIGQGVGIYNRSEQASRVYRIRVNGVMAPPVSSSP